MSLDKSLRSFLIAADTGAVTIEQQKISQESDLPWIYYERASRNQERLLDGSGSTLTETYNLEVIADDITTAQAVADAARAALDGHIGAFGSDAVSFITVDDQSDDYETRVDVGGNDSGLFNCALSITIMVA